MLYINLPHCEMALEYVDARPLPNNEVELSLKYTPMEDGDIREPIILKYTTENKFQLDKDWVDQCNEELHKLPNSTIISAVYRLLRNGKL